MAETTPQIREEAAKPLVTVRKPIPMRVSAAKKKELRNKTLWSVEDLYIDRPIEEGGFNSFAADGRESLEIDAALVRSLLRMHERYKGECAYLSISPAKVTICGDDETQLLVVLNGRQRTKAIEYINRMARLGYDMWEKMPGGKTEENRVRLKNQFIAYANAGHNEPEGACKDFALFFQEGAETNEAIECLLGGRVGGAPQPGFLTLSRDTLQGPLPFKVKVEITDVDPNEREALHISIAERINVPTQPLTECMQIKALLEAGDSYTTIADLYGANQRTIANKLLVLATIPQVQQAYNEKKISLKIIVDHFFVNTSARGYVAKSIEEQARLCERFAGAPTRAKGIPTQAEISKEEKAWPTDLKCSGCGEIVFANTGSRMPNGQIRHLSAHCKHPDGKGYCSGEPLTNAQIDTTIPGAKNRTPEQIASSPPAAQTPGGTVAGPGGAKTGSPTAGATPKRRNPTAAATGIMSHLPRASELVYEISESVRIEGSDGIEVVKSKMERKAKLNAVACIMSWLGGKSDALDVDADLKDTVLTAMAQADIDATAETNRKIEAQNTSPETNAMMLLDNAFTAWEEKPIDSRGDWPEVEAPEVMAMLAKVQVAYAEGLSSGNADFKRDFEGRKADFARDWIINNA